MALLAYNLTLSPLVITAGDDSITLPASLVAGSRGLAVNVSSYFRLLTAAQQIAIEAQRVAEDLDVIWSDQPEYETGSLYVRGAQVDAWRALELLGEGGGPGTGVTLPIAYSHGVAGPQVIAEDATRLGVVFRGRSGGAEVILGAQSALSAELFGVYADHVQLGAAACPAKLYETGGASLAVAGITDGYLLKRVGTNIVSVDPATIGVTDHGALTGLTDDDHTIYYLANGSRALNGNLQFDGGSRSILGDTGASETAGYNVIVKGGTGGWSADPETGKAGGNVLLRGGDPYGGGNAGYVLAGDDGSRFGVGAFTARPDGLFHVMVGSTAVAQYVDNIFGNVVGPTVALRKARGTYASKTTVAAADELGCIEFYGYDGDSWEEAAAIRAYATGTVADERVPSYLSIFTATDAAPSVLTEACRINSNQSLNLLNHVLYGGTAATDALVLKSTSGTGTTDYISLCVGTDGATEGLRIGNGGSLTILSTTTATSGVIFKGANRFVHDYLPTHAGAVGRNTFLGVGSGSLTMLGTVSYEASNNTGVGWGALGALTTGWRNTAVGASSLAAATNALRCTAVGHNTLAVNTSGTDNTCIGFGAGGATYSSGNTVLGSSALAGSLITNGFNTALGYAAGNLCTGASNVFIGYNAGSTLTAVSNLLIISNSNTATPLIYGDFSTGYIKIHSAGSATNNTNVLTLENLSNAAAMTNTRTSILWNQWYYDAGTPAVADAASITVGTEGNWTSTASTQDAYMAFSTAVNGTVTEWGRFVSSGWLSLNPSTTPQTAMLLDIAAPAAGGGETLRNSHVIDLRSRMHEADDTPHYCDWTVQNRPAASGAGVAGLFFNVSLDGGNAYPAMAIYAGAGGDIFLGNEASSGSEAWKFLPFDKSGADISGDSLTIRAGKASGTGTGGTLTADAGASGGGANGDLNLGTSYAVEVNIGRAAGELGFYGAEAVTKQSLAASPTAAQIATVLSNLGLVTLT